MNIASASNDPFLIRVLRALRDRPGSVFARARAVIAQPIRRRWSQIAPRLFTTRRLLAAARATSVEDLWERLKRQPFFLSPNDRQAWTRLFEETYPGARDEVLRRADTALRHEFDLLGSGPKALGARLPWHTDFKTGRTWPLDHASTIQYAELDRPTDVKVPWELSRCQHFTALGQAYWLTRDERYAREFVEEVDDWTDRNPWGYGVNWACAMDVALRAVSWVWAFYYCVDSDACRSPTFRARLLRSLFLHGEHIATHLERGEVNGNHYLCDGVGLVFLGILFRDTAKGRLWLELGRDIVIDEIQRQTTADGVDFEQSTAYHRLVLEGFATSYLLLRAAGEHVPDQAWSRLERMYEYLEAYTKPDGSVPLIGDADDGRIQKLGYEPINDHRYLLSTGAVVFGRGALKRAAGRFWEDSFWLLGPDGVATFANLELDRSVRQSKAFGDGGFFVLRSDDAHVIVDCGDVGMHGRGGHGHNDILSFEFWMKGANWVTDCGAYLYTASREWRNRFRSTEFHNTPQVDGEEVNRFLGPDFLWQLHDDARPTEAALARGGDTDTFVGGHSGYHRLPEPVTVSRELAFDRQHATLRVRDTVTGIGTHRVASRFHLDPAVSAEICGRDVRLSRSGRDLWLQIDHPDTFTVSVETSWVSPSYGVRVPGIVVVCAGTAPVPIVLSYLFSESRTASRS